MKKRSMAYYLRRARLRDLISKKKSLRKSEVLATIPTVKFLQPTRKTWGELTYRPITVADIS
ncbi:hypothetical protein WBO78_24320 [Bosea sp. CCNWLW174]|uniref:hypothetical protein n=1 Tax=Bosea sp. CCNWLW174 TaxID=3128896 RepID=UPI0030637BC7